jgi:hypothetical protein
MSRFPEARARWSASPPAETVHWMDIARLGVRLARRGIEEAGRACQRACTTADCPVSLTA